ncbi:MAG TPA: L,D-transpeptidase family protein [Steroidobacteraceae bacterium]
MNRARIISLLSAVLGWALCVAPVGTAMAQGFASISSAGPATPAVAGVAAEAAPATPAPTPTPGPAPAAAVPVPETAKPVAQMASLGFSSVSGATPDVTQGMPSGAEARRTGGSNAVFEQADKVLVVKHERRLYLLKGDRVVAEYPVRLGLNPYGHKQQEGDFRTPEGKYQLTRRNAQSDFYLSIQVSYPNREDAAWAKENGWRAGGLIMIHGQPNVPKRSAEFYATRDWTDGCIALSNADMTDLWLRTTAGIPIEIRR